MNGLFSKAGSERLASVVALLYLALLPLNIPLRPPLFLHDLLAPVFVGILCVRGGFRRVIRFPESLLGLFLLLALLATVTHMRGLGDLYEPAIFLYMGVLYWFFAGCRLGSRQRLALGLGTLVACAGFALVQWLSGMRTSYQVYEGSTLGFMATRFFFTFSHPNLAASFLVLPVTLVLSVLHERWPELRRGERLAWAAAAPVLLAPLLLTVSRHMLLTGALGLGFLVAIRGRRRGAWIAALALLALVFGLFYLTLVVPFFPLQGRFPFFNYSTPGMYMTHQAIYLKMLFLGAGEFLLGLGKSGVVAVYPQLADWDHIYAVLAQYKQEFLTASFATYMDAHNEYLNLATAFGVPAMVCCIGFWAGSLRERRRAPAWPLSVCFVIAVLLCCLWDDLLSKRWIWVTLGILAGLQADSDTATTTAEPERG